MKREEVLSQWDERLRRILFRAVEEALIDEKAHGREYSEEEIQNALEFVSLHLDHI